MTIARREDLETQISVAGVFLDQTPFVIKRARGFASEPTIIRQGGEKFQLLKDAIGIAEMQPVTIRVINGPGADPDAPSEDYELLVSSLTQDTDGGAMVLVLADARVKLERGVFPFDINVRIGQVRDSDVVYERGTGGDEIDVQVPMTLGTMVRRLTSVLNTPAEDGGPDLKIDIVLSGGVDGDRVLRDNIFLARKNVKLGLAALFTEMQLGLFPARDGAIEVVDTRPLSDVLAKLDGIAFKTKPSWVADNRVQLGVPKNVVGLYTPMREFNVEASGGTIKETGTDNRPIARMDQMYPGRDGSYVTLDGLLNSYSLALQAAGDEAIITDAVIAKHIIRGAWIGTVLQQFIERMSSTDDTEIRLAPDISEALRVTLARQIVPIIEANWRQLLRIDLWEAPSPPREWLFGSFTDDGVFQEAAVKLNYVDFFSRPFLQDDLIGRVELELDRIRRTQQYGFDTAPFLVGWDGKKGLEQGVLRLVPQPANGVTARSIGELTTEDVLTEVGAVEDRSGFFKKRFRRLVWASNTAFSPEFTANFLLQVSMVMPDRRAADGSGPYGAWQRVSAVAFPDSGDVPAFFVQTDDRLTANFKDAEGPALNQEALTADMEERAKPIIEFFQRVRGGQGLSQALQLKDFLAEQAVLRADVEVHTQGLGTVMINVVLGHTKTHASGLQKENKRLVGKEQREQEIAGTDFREIGEAPGADLPPPPSPLIAGETTDTV